MKYLLRFLDRFIFSAISLTFCIGIILCLPFMLFLSFLWDFKIHKKDFEEVFDLLKEIPDYVMLKYKISEIFKEIEKNP